MQSYILQSLSKDGWTGSIGYMARVPHKSQLSTLFFIVVE